MINPKMVNSFYLWSINGTIDIHRTTEKYLEILKIVNVSLKDGSIAVDYKLKMNVLKNIIEVIVNKKVSIDSAINSVMMVPKYNDQSLVSYIDRIQEEVINVDKQKEITDDIAAVIKYAYLKDRYPDMKKTMDLLETGNYNTIQEGWEIFTTGIRTLYKLTADIESSIAMASESRLDMSNADELKKADRQMCERYSSFKKIPTGFGYLDDEILLGGFEKTRLYCFAGSTGSGKSTLLTNFALNASKFSYINPEFNDKIKLFPYITLENDKIETYSRIICSYFDIDKVQYLRMSELDRHGLLDSFQHDMINKYKSHILVEELMVESVSSATIAAIIESAIEEYGGKDKVIVPAVYIDYLDLMKSDISQKGEHRLVLQDITQELKNLGKQYDIPVITATQLNRESFKVKNAFELNLSFVAESVGKVFISDMVALLAMNQLDNTIVHFRIGKYRGGDTGVPMDFKVNFNHNKFISCKPASLNNEIDNTNTNAQNFKGFGDMKF